MTPPRRSAGGTMKMRKVLFVGLCVLCLGQHARADNDASPGFKDALASKVALSAVDALGKKPVELLIADAYPVVVRDGFKKMYRAVKSFLLTLIYGDIEEVSDMVMAELQAYLFGAGRVQEKIWRKLRNAFRDHLREWWLNSLVDPYEALKTGVWQALLKLTVDDLSVVMGGTPQYERVKELLLDEDAEVIGQWVKRIKRNMMQGVDQQQPERMFPQKQSPRRGKSTKQQAGKTATNEGSDSTVRGAPADDTQVAAKTQVSRRGKFTKQEGGNTPRDKDSDSTVEGDPVDGTQATANTQVSSRKGELTNQETGNTPRLRAPAAP